MRNAFILFIFFLSSISIHAAIQINTADELLDLMNQTAPFHDWSADYELTADIDMSGYNSTTTRATAPIGNTTTNFTGSFDGKGYVIRNLKINQNNNAGLFGILDDGAIILNLGLENVDISGSINIGGICGWVFNGIIRSCYTTGNISVSNNIGGGICGELFEGQISNCYSMANVTGGNLIGSFIGCNGSTDGRIWNCYSTGNVSGGSNVGGFTGGNYDIIENCYSTGDAFGTENVGGFCGFNNLSEINNCYSTGEVTGTTNTGGFCGQCISGGNIYYSYSTGYVAGTTNTGGFCGYILSSTLECCFWSEDTSGMTDGVGSEDPDPEGVTGLNNSQFANQTNFSCYDFGGIWMMAGGRPVLTELTIPTLSEWAVIIFIGLLAGVGGWFVWRRM